MDSPAVQGVITGVLFILRIITPLLSLVVVARCFLSFKAGQRKEEPVIVLEDVVSKTRIPVLYWENSLGRSKSCDIVLPDNTASRDHAVLMRRESGWVVTDTDSKSGTRINGKKVTKDAPVFPGDVLNMGSTSLMLKRVTDAPIRTPKRRVRRAANPTGLLLLTTFIHLLLLVQSCFSGGQFSALPVLPFVLVTVIEWGMFFYSTRGLNHVSFELEPIGFLLSGIGIMLLSGTRAALPEGAEAPGPMDIFNFSLMKTTYMQVITLLLGVLIFCFLIWFMNDLERVMKFRTFIAIGAILLFAANLALARGNASHGAGNWIYIGPISIQPSEFIKIAFVFVGASTLDRLQTARNLTGFILFSAACLGCLFLMNDFGTACIFFVTFLLVAFMRSGSVRTVALAIAAAVLGLFLILTFRPHVVSRFEGWRHVWEYTNDSQGYQQTRVLSYGSSGGLFGVGLGEGALAGGKSGKPVFAATSDLVFGMAWEELGLLMAVIIVAAIALLVFYARSDATKSRSTFYSISACSAAGLLLFQTCLNIFGATDVLPLTGVTLPFISAGGSSMAAVWGLLAFIKASDERTYAARRSKKNR